MAAQYTEISLEEMETFLKRAFRALRPKQGVHRGEYYYDLKLSDHVIVRVWTSVQRGSQSGASVGQDAIRVQLMGAQVERPLMKGKAPIVKRTQGWKNSLQGKIEDMMETYEEKPDYWDSRGSGSSAPAEIAPRDRYEEPDDWDPADEPREVAPSSPPSRPAPQKGIPITPPQLKYLGFLMRGPKGHSSEIRGLLYDYGIEEPYDAEVLGRLTKAQATNLISRMAPERRYAEDAELSDPNPSYSYDFRGVN
jgi:hypothetical protein